MASTIASNARTGQSGSWGSRAAFSTASGLYVVVMDTSGVKIRVYKSTDGTTWTQQDSSNALTPTAATACFSCTIAVGVIYIAYFNTTTSIRVHKFDTSSDTFTGNVGSGDANGASNTPTSFGQVRVAVRSDGDVVIVYTRSSGGIYWTRYEGSSWAATSVLDSGSNIPNDLLMMASDRAIALYAQDAANDHSYRTISSANALGTVVDLDTSVATNPSGAFLGCVFNDGTNDKIGLVLVDSTNELDFYHAIQGEPLGSATAVSGVNTAGNEPQLTGAAVETFNSKVYVCWSKANTVLYDSTTSLTTLTFGTDQTLIGSLTDTDPIPQFIKGLSALGVIYNDNGAVKVEWITAPASSPITISGVLATGSATTSNPTPRVLPQITLSTGSSAPSTPTPIIKPQSTLSTGSGAPFSPTLKEIAQITLSTGSALALTPTSLIVAQVPLMTGSALSFDPAFLIGPNTFVVPLMTGSPLLSAPTIQAIVQSVLASLSGDSFSTTPIATVKPPAGAASANSLDPSLADTIVATLMTASASMIDPAFLIGPNTFSVPLATGSAMEFDPFINVPVFVAVPLMTGSADSQPPSVKAIALIPLATVTGATGTPTVIAILSPPIASASASLLDPAFFIGPNLFAVPVMTGSGDTLTVVVRSTVQGTLSTGSAQSFDPLVRLTVLDSVAAASGDLLPPSTQEGATFVVIPRAGSSGDSFVPVPLITAQIPRSTGSASASNPTLKITIPVSVAVAAGLFSDPDVVIQAAQPITVSVTLSQADAQFFPPSLSDKILVTVASASIDGAAPTPVIEVHSPLVGVSADGKTPVLKSIVLVPQLVGSLTGIDPSTVQVFPMSLASADGMLLDPTIEARVVVDDMSAIGTFLEPFIKAGSPWAMQFVAMTRTLAFETIERSLDLNALARVLTFDAEGRVLDMEALARAFTLVAED